MLLGGVYSYGLGVKKSRTKSAYWWKKAAAQGNIKAEKDLANDYAHGIGVTRSRTKAVYWENKAAEQEIEEYGPTERR